MYFQSPSLPASVPRKSGLLYSDSLSRARGKVYSRIDWRRRSGAGIQPGDVILSVNRRVVTTTDDFLQALERSGKTGRVLLLVKTPRFTRFVVIPLE